VFDTDISGSFPDIQLKNRSIGGRACLSNHHDVFEFLLAEGDRRQHIQRRSKNPATGIIKIYYNHTENCLQV